MKQIMALKDIKTQNSKPAQKNLKVWRKCFFTVTILNLVYGKHPGVQSHQRKGKEVVHLEQQGSLGDE